MLFGEGDLLGFNDNSCQMDGCQPHTNTCPVPGVQRRDTSREHVRDVSKDDWRQRDVNGR